MPGLESGSSFKTGIGIGFWYRGSGLGSMSGFDIGVRGRVFGQESGSGFGTGVRVEVGFGFRFWDGG